MHAPDSMAAILLAVAALGFSNVIGRANGRKDIMFSRTWLFSVLTSATFLSQPHIVGAQTLGHVIGEWGEPIPDVAVEAWTLANRVANSMTNAGGGFRIDWKGSQPAQIIVSRVGYATSYIRIAKADTSLTVQLVAAPVKLEPVIASGKVQRIMCPHKNDPAARELWRNTRSRYSLETITRGSMSEGRKAADGRDASAVGSVDFSKLRWFKQYLNAYHLTPLQAPERFGYAVRIHTDRGEAVLDGESNEWLYPKFHGVASAHFASDEFANRHALFVVSRDAENGTLLGFCPRVGVPAEISGILAVSASGDFEWVTWRFSTDKPHEDAGGRAFLTKVADPLGGPPHLLPSAGIFWRRVSGQKQMVQFTYVFDSWVVSVDRCRPDYAKRSDFDRSQTGCQTLLPPAK